MNVTRMVYKKFNGRDSVLVFCGTRQFECRFEDRFKGYGIVAGEQLLLDDHGQYIVKMDLKACLEVIRTLPEVPDEA